MPNIGPMEIAIILGLALLVFGPKRLPELGRSLGGGMREFKRSITGFGGDDDAVTLNSKNEAEGAHAGA